MHRIFVICLLLLGAGTAFAQESSGQFCVRSYEDVNANGLFDTETERLITRGVSVELLDSNGVVVGSAMLDKSPNASYGIICFYNLGQGEYSVLISSADYIATTDRLVTQTVNTTAPTIIEFGARRMSSIETAGTANSTSPTPGTTTNDMMLRMGVSAAGAAVIMVLFMLTGFVVFGLRSRKPQRKPVNFSDESVRTMEPVPPVSAQDTPSSPEQAYAPPFQEPPISDEDTNPTNS
jgi:hypothetical protein